MGKHIKSLLMCSRQKVGGLYRVLHIFALGLTTCTHKCQAKFWKFHKDLCDEPVLTVESLGQNVGDRTNQRSP